MSYITDLHIHSRFANATSPELTLPAIAAWGERKGIDVLGTGDFTHPEWLKELKDSLTIDYETGLYRMRERDTGPLFCFSTEVSLVYKDDGHTKKIHLILLAPDLGVVEEINHMLSGYGNLADDGRPTLSITPDVLVQKVLEISPLCEIIPAHIWTPWYGVLGKRFGYDDLKACFKDSINHIHAIETGISSDPYMNWLVFEKQKIAIVSYSDAHSLPKLGREATVMQGDMSYSSIITGIRKNAIEYTIEYFPEGGMYHYSGHRKCNVVVDPEKDLVIKGICPVCHRKLTQGVYRRVYDVALAENSMGYIGFVEHNSTRDEQGFIHMDDRKPFVRLVPLEQIVASSLGIKSTKAKRVTEMYTRIMDEFGLSELALLLHPPVSMKEGYPLIYENILRVLRGEVEVVPGYDHVYGNIILPHSVA